MQLLKWRSRIKLTVSYETVLFTRPVFFSHRILLRSGGVVLHECQPFFRFWYFEYLMLAGKRVGKFQRAGVQCKARERICFCAVVVVAGKRVSF